MKCYAIENHPCDSRVTMDDSGIVQTLNARMGTGGGNVPLVLMTISGTNSHARIKSGETSPALMARMGTGGNNTPLILLPVCAIASTSRNAEMTDGEISPTLMARAGTDGNQLPIVALKRTEE